MPYLFFTSFTQQSCVDCNKLLRVDGMLILPLKLHLFFFNKITQFPFIATFIVTSKSMAYTAQLTVGLQKRALDIFKAYQHIKVIMDTVDSADEYHEKWFIEAVDMVWLSLWMFNQL